jgi:hypothetical protein
MQTYNEEDVREFGGGEEELPLEAEQEELEEELGEEPELEEEESSEPETPAQRIAAEDAHQKKIKTRLNQVQREKYQALDELARTRDELEKTRAMADLTAQSAMRHYDDNVIQRLEKARQLKASAYESGDIQSQVDADVELSIATNELHNLNTWKVQQSYRQPIQEPSYAPSPYAGKEPVIQDWIRDNSWVNPQSNDYDPDLTDQVARYCQEYDNNLINAGYGDAIFSEQYREKINEFVDHFRQSNYHQGRRELNMRTSRSPVSPVRSSGQNYQQSSQTRGALNADEKDMARRLGISEKEMYAAVLNDKRTNAQKRGGR